MTQFITPIRFHPLNKFPSISFPYTGTGDDLDSRNMYLIPTKRWKIMLKKLQKEEGNTANGKGEWSYKTGVCPHRGNPSDCVCEKRMNVLCHGNDKLMMRISEGKQKPVFPMVEVRGEIMIDGNCLKDTIF